MQEKSTQELNAILGKTHPSKVDDFLTEEEENLYTGDSAFTDYMRKTINSKGISQSNVFKKAYISEKNGYRLIAKKETATRKRDVLLRLCYAADFTFEETQKALRLYPMPELYAKFPRDAVLISAFQHRKTDIDDLNQLLKDCGHEELDNYGKDPI